jgi:UDP-N-acetyl-D-glucosamine dehydrogenase
MLTTPTPTPTPLPAPTLARDSHSALKDKLLHRTATIGVVGLGYVGLPLAVEKAKVGFHVLGFDRNPARVAKVNAGESYIADVHPAELEAIARSQTITATVDTARLADCDVVVVCIPTPLTANRAPDVSYIRNVAEQIAATLRPGQLVTLESTTYPGTTEEVVLPILAGTGLKVGIDFFLSFSPERVDAGNRRYSTRNTNKVLGAVTPACLEVAAMFYQQTIVDVVTVSSPRVAEMTKVFENTFRSVNIALVNELTLLCDRMGINVWEVVDAAATKPFGIMRFDPGPGVGGYSIPVDPFYLAWKAKQYDFSTRFIELAGEVNRSMPTFVREKIVRALNERERSVHGARIMFAGVAYKRNVADWRDAPALKLLEMLERDGAEIVYHDPLVPEIVDYAGRARHSVALSAERLRESDCVVVLADHTAIDWRLVLSAASLIVDTRNVYGELNDEKHVVRL